LSPADRDRAANGPTANCSKRRQPTCCTLDSGSRARSPRWGAVGTIARLPEPSAALRPFPAPRAVLRRPLTDRLLAASGRLLTARQGYRPAQRARRQSQRTRQVPDSIIVLRHAAVTLPSGAGDRRPRGTRHHQVLRGFAATRPHRKVWLATSCPAGMRLR
jgi:hypothetical protein